MGGNRRVRRLVARGALRRVPLRRGLLVTPRDNWPPPDGSLALEPAGHAPDGVPLFRYTHSPAYMARPLVTAGGVFCRAGCVAGKRMHECPDAAVQFAENVWWGLYLPHPTCFDEHPRVV